MDLLERTCAVRVDLVARYGLTTVEAYYRACRLRSLRPPDSDLSLICGDLGGRRGLQGHCGRID